MSGEGCSRISLSCILHFLHFSPSSPLFKDPSSSSSSRPYLTPESASLLLCVWGQGTTFVIEVSFIQRGEWKEEEEEEGKLKTRVKFAFWSCTLFSYFSSYRDHRGLRSPFVLVLAEKKIDPTELLKMLSSVSSQPIFILLCIILC